MSTAVISVTVGGGTLITARAAVKTMDQSGAIITTAVTLERNEFTQRDYRVTSNASATLVVGIVGHLVREVAKAFLLPKLSTSHLRFRAVWIWQDRLTVHR